MSAQMPNAKSLVVLCDCGPILKELLDLDGLETAAANIPGVGAVVRHSTLCSPEGKSWLVDRLREHPNMRPVIAACSPREHADTFISVCNEADRNPYTMSRANLREQCAWVTPDMDEATAKALDLISAAVARVELQEPLTAPEIDCETSVMVVGSGVAGMTAARMIAASGRDVVLVEREDAIGGIVPLLGETFPDMECAPCMVEPLMDDVLHNDRIEVLTSSEIDEVVGYLGNFNVRITTRARHVDPAACFACQTCSGVCPVQVPDPLSAGLASRFAIGLPYIGALPNASALNESACIRFNGGECSICADSCPFGAIDLEQTASTSERHVGAIILATGSREHADSSAEPWSSRSVFTTWEFERLTNPDGPTEGRLAAEGQAEPRNIAFVHCSDGSGIAPVDTCSHTCCLAIAKQIEELRDKHPDVTVTEFSWDRTLGGPHYLANGTNHTVGIRLDAGDRLEIHSEDMGASVTWTSNGLEQNRSFDLVVAAVPQQPTSSAVNAALVAGVDVDDKGFVIPVHRRLTSFATRVDGVFVAGSAQEPRDIRDATAHAAAAAGAVISALVEGRRLVREAATAIVDAELCGGCRTCVLSCPYHAVTFDEETRAAVVNELLCRGCGTCAACCPSSAIRARHFTDDQLLAEIETLAESVATHAGKATDSEGVTST